MNQGFDALHRDDAGDWWMSTNGKPGSNGRAVRLPEADLMDLDAVPAMHMAAPPQHLLALTEEDSVGAENFRSLAIRLRNFQKRRQLKKLLVTSSIKGEGKSVISANLAITLARRERTLLIDGDMHQAGLREVLGSQAQAGLADWWRHPEPITNFLTRLDGRSLWYLSAGEVVEDPLEILQSPRLVEMLNQVAGRFDWIIIDSPPLVPVPDSGLWAAQVDGTLLVVRHGTTPKSLLTKALETENLKLLGIVTNEWQDIHQQYYGRYYGYSRKTSVAAPAATPLSERKSLKVPNSASK